jgi:membrane protease YdiL (CAAX protease family)
MIREETIPDMKLYFLYYMLVSSTSQEFLFRSVIWAEYKRLGLQKKWLYVLISGFAFAFMHIIYHDWLTILSVSGMGIAWSWTYARYPNFWGVAFSHAFIGSYAIFTGLI